MPKWIRVRDTQTKHTFDVEASALERRRGVEPVNDPERWPDLEGALARPRPPKPFVGKGGGAATPAQSPGDPAPSEGSPPGEPTPTDGGRTRRTKTSTPADAPADTDAPKE